MRKLNSKDGFTLIESIVMLALIVLTGVMTFSLLRKDVMGLDTSQPVDTKLNDLFRFEDDGEKGVSIEGLPEISESDWSGEIDPPESSESEDGSTPQPGAPLE